jgi:dipeptidyl aminopeptidase/acylaminoacyl peptidase
LLLVLAPALAGLAAAPSASPAQAAGDPLPPRAVLRLAPVAPNPGGKVLALALAPSGKVLATGHGDGTVRLWDAATGKALHRLAEGKAPVTALAWLPDGRRLLSANAEGLLVLWDQQTARAERQFRLAGGVVRAANLALSPDGRTAALGGSRVQLVDVEAWKELDRLPAAGYYLVFAPDGKALITASERKEVRTVFTAWDAGSRKPRRRYPWPKTPQFEDFITALAVIPDGRSVVSGNQDGLVLLWETATGDVQAEFWTHPRAVTALAVSADGRYLASAGDDKSVRVRDLVSGWPVARFQGHRDHITAVAFSPDARRVYSASADGTVLGWRGPESEPTEQPAEPKAEELQAAWKELGEPDARAAYRASRKLLGAPGASVAFLRGQLRPAAPLEAGKAEKLVADLSDAQFAKREQAATGLEKLGRRAIPALRKALAGKQSEEVRRRVLALLERLTPEEISAEEVQQRRALEVLEYAGTPEARRLLEELARGAPGPLLTAWASAALERLKRQRPAP